MAVTTIEEQIIRLRSYLSPYLKGPNVDAVIAALASGNAAYLINSVHSVNDQLYIATASEHYLDERLAQFGLTRPPAIGLSDDIFRQIGIQIKNRKQIRDLIDNILNLIFGDEYTKAVNKARRVEPYNLQNGDTLIVNFDESHTVTIPFITSEFSNIAAAKAQEVADVITKNLRNQGFTGTALSKNDGDGPYVELLSDTIGPVSSVTVLGGRAQNEFRFDAPVAAGGNMSTQWTLSLQSGGIIRFTWSAGVDPQLGRVNVGNYVNIFGGGFTSSVNEGSYTVVTSVGGAVNLSYFEILNPLGTSGIVVQGSDDALIFYNPVKKTLTSQLSYAALYQTQARVLQIFLPASTVVTRRDRIGSAHLHDPPRGTFAFNATRIIGDTHSNTTIDGIASTAGLFVGDSILGSGIPPNTHIASVSVNSITINNPAILTNSDVMLTVNANAHSGDQFFITSAITLVAGTDFLIGANAQITASNLVAKINSLTGLKSTEGVNLVSVFNYSLNNTLTMTYTGSANISGSGPLGDNISLEPDQQGPYMYDLSQSFTVGSEASILTQDLDGTMPRVFTVTDSSQFPDEQGYLVIGYGTEEQEGPIPYIATPSGTTLLISPAYTIQKFHAIGSNVSLIPNKAPITVSKDGTDYPFYITDVVGGRLYAQDLINSIVATGISIVFTILYPNDIGLGKWGTIYSENPAIWGPDGPIPPILTEPGES